MFYDTSSVTRQGSCHLPPLGKACRKSSLFLLKCYFFKSLWQSNKKAVIYFQIPLNPSVRRVRRVYTLILRFTFNYALHFSTKTFNLTRQCFLLVTFLSRKKSDKSRPRVLASYASRVLFLFKNVELAYEVICDDDNEGRDDLCPHACSYQNTDYAKRRVVQSFE